MPGTYALSEAQLECLTMPMRLAIVQRLGSDHEATARELAKRMGRPATSLYHHLNQLVEIGLVRIAGERRGARRPEAIYTLVADDLITTEAVKTAEGREAYMRSAMRLGESAARAVAAAVRLCKSRFDGNDRNTRVRYYMLRADKAKLSKINRIVDELEACLSQAGPEDGEEVVFTYFLSPQHLR